MKPKSQVRSVIRDYLYAVENGVLDATHHPYETISHYTCRFIIPDDATTGTTIRTQTASVFFSTSPEGALAQTKTGNQYSHQLYASYILGYVRDNLPTIDVDDTNLTFIDEPTITPMSNENVRVSVGM